MTFTSRRCVLLYQEKENIKVDRRHYNLTVPALRVIISLFSRFIPAKTLVIHKPSLFTILDEFLPYLIVSFRSAEII